MSCSSNFQTTPTSAANHPLVLTKGQITIDGDGKQTRDFI